MNSKNQFKKIFLSSLLAVIIVFSQGLINSIEGQSITILDINLDSEPDSFAVSVAGPAGYAGRIEITSLQDENNTQRVELYYQHCIVLDVIMSYDTVFAIEAEYPYNLLLLTFLDTTSYSSEPPVCQIQYENIVPVDTLLLTAEQILSTRPPESDLDEIKVFPNPASNGWIKIEIPTSVNLTGVNLMDPTGKLIWKSRGPKSEFEIDFLPSGLYLLAIETNQGIAYRRFVKQ